MDEVWSVLAALATVVLPMVLAWWLLGRPGRERHGKIPDKEDR